MSVDPTFLQTAIEIAVRAGEIQLARQGTDLGVEKKGPIDIVTEVDLEGERLDAEDSLNKVKIYPMVNLGLRIGVGG